MKVDRRCFLVGVTAAAVTGKAALPSSIKGLESNTHVVPALHPLLSARAVVSLEFSNMATAEELRSPEWREDPSQWSFMRGADETFLAIDLNPRATFRWVPVLGHEVEVDDENPFCFVVRPCQTFVTLTLESTALGGMAIKEACRWENGILTLHDVTGASLKAEKWVAKLRKEAERGA